MWGCRSQNIQTKNWAGLVALQSEGRQTSSSSSVSSVCRGSPPPSSHLENILYEKVHNKAIFPARVGQDVACSIMFVSQTIPDHLSPSWGHFSFIKAGVRIRVKSEDNRPCIVHHNGTAGRKVRAGRKFKYDFYLLSWISYFLRTFVSSAMNSSFLCKKSKISRDPLTGASSNLEKDSPSVSEKEEV